MENLRPNKTGIIILAAGASSRMGQPKQLLTVKGKSLLLHSVGTALQCNNSDVIVVLGAEADACAEQLRHLPVTMVTNHTWEAGMGSSIKSGLLTYMERNPEGQSTLIMVVDQPKVHASHLQTLIDSLRNFDKTIVASFYENLPGVPAVFSRQHFHEILSMDDSSGAKRILLNHPNEILSIGFPEGIIDLDTPEEYERFIKSE